MSESARSVRPELTMREAAAACEVSFSTIRRKREAGAFPAARRHERRGWMIPVGDLLAAGLRVNPPAPPEQSGQPRGPGPGAVGEPAAPEGGRAEFAELVRLAQELGAARAEVRHLREANALQRAHLDDARMMLRALTSATPDAGEAERAQVPAQGAPVERGVERVSGPAEKPGEVDSEVRKRRGDTPGRQDREQQPGGRRRRWWPHRT